MRKILLALAGLGLATGLPSLAYGHGGQFGGPIGKVPNGLRPPEDPTPPTPIDPHPGGDQPVDPPPTTPTGGGGQPPTVTPTPPGGLSTPDGGTGRGRQATLSMDDWTFWWAYNSADILRVKEHLYGIRGSGAGVFGMGEGRGSHDDATRATARQVKQSVIPALLWAMDPANRQHPDTESAAYLALAKVTDDPAHIPALVRGILVDDAEAKERDTIVRESAILSLGLLRRAEPARRFDAKELDGVREVCFRVLADGGFSSRIRSFAAFSLGLLGDQPTRAGATTGGEPLAGTAAPMAASERLFDLLRLEYAGPDVPASLLLALSLQPATSITPDMREVVAQAALRGRLYKASLDGVVQSYAALALGRMGTASEIGVLLNVLAVRTAPTFAKRSAAIALGRLAERVDGPARATLAADLIRLASASRDGTTRNFGLMSLAHVLAVEAEANRTDVLNAKGGDLVETLFRAARDGNAVERPYGALALGLLGRAIGEKPEVLECGKVRLRVIGALADGFAEKGLSPRVRAAFAIGMGLVGDPAAVGRLVPVVADRGADGELRGYAAVAIGLVGIPAPEAVAAVRAALLERSSEELRLQCAVALGLLGQAGAVDVLLRELAESDSQFVQGQVVLALGKIGDARAIPPLVAMLKDPQRPDLTRAMACAGLGLVGDLEMLPSLAILSNGINYRALVDAVREYLSIL